MSHYKAIAWLNRCVARVPLYLLSRSFMIPKPQFSNCILILSLIELNSRAVRYNSSKTQWPLWVQKGVLSKGDCICSDSWVNDRDQMSTEGNSSVTLSPGSKTQVESEELDQFWYLTNNSVARDLHQRLSLIHWQFTHGHNNPGVFICKLQGKKAQVRVNKTVTLVTH